MTESTTKTELGKIKSAYFGKGDRGDLGLFLEFSFSEMRGVNWSQSFWDYNETPHSKYCDWTEEQRDGYYLRLVKEISNYLHQAKVDRIEKLKNIPVELTFKGSVLISWRILTEVL